MISLPVIFGRAGEATCPDYYTQVAERAASTAEGRSGRLFIRIDAAGRFVVDDHAGEPRYLVMAFDNACDPDLIASEIIEAVKSRGLDFGSFRGRPRRVKP
jgi:hypothetical protein